MASIDARMAMPIAVPLDVVSLSMASISLCWSVVEGRRAPRSRQRDEADLGAVVLAADEPPRRLLGHDEAVRRDVGRAHRTGDVDRQQHRA
jgi:hypothetical protein